MDTVVTLKDLVTLLVFGALAPTISYQFVKWLRDEIPQWTYLATWWISVAVAPAIAVVFWGVGLAMGYFPQPGPDARLWIEAIFTVAYPVTIVAAGIHAATKSATLPDSGKKIDVLSVTDVAAPYISRPMAFEAPKPPTATTTANAPTVTYAPPQNPPKAPDAPRTSY